jgi:capsular exopolysaccharide synthesis family protein
MSSRNAVNQGFNNEEKVYDLARLRRVIRERWWVVLLVCLAVGAAAFAASHVLSPRYDATAQITYSPEQAQLASEALYSSGTSGTAGTAHNIMSDALTMSTLSFAQRVAGTMGVGTDPATLLKTVKITPRQDVDVIDVKVTGGDEAAVVSTANAFANEFVKGREEASTQALAEAQKLLQARIDSLSPADKQSAYGVALSQRRDDLAVLISTGISDYAILQAATAPPAPYFPRPFLNLELGLLVGLILGLGLAVLLDYRDPHIKAQRSLEQIMEMPVIGMAPSLGRTSRKKPRGTGRTIGFGQGNEALLESMRTLRSNLGLLGFGEGKRSVLVTSQVAGEGKSTLAANLALIMALSGRRVVLIDADLRSPTIHSCLGLANVRGLSDTLAGKGSWAANAQCVDLSRFVDPGMELVREPAQFLCLTSGPTPSNASEMLESPAMARVIAELGELADYVILDGPPMLASPDAVTMAKFTGAVLLCSKLGETTAAEAQQTRTLLAQAQAASFGIVVTGAKLKAKREYSSEHSPQRAPESHAAPEPRMAPEPCTAPDREAIAQAG